MKIQYIKKRFNKASVAMIQHANAIVESNESHGFSLTLRQLYYRLVAKNIIVNSIRSYKNLGALLSEARLAGLVDWDSLEDRERPLRGTKTYDNASDSINDAAKTFFMDWHKTQPTRIEVWVEKNTLLDLAAHACAPYHVDYFSCKGYSSQTGLHNAAMRHAGYARDGQKSLILYVGDHDPSGKDMTRDIRDRFEMFGVEVEVDRIMLNMDQIKKYNPPPNPAKIKDSRYEAYKAEFGVKCWELEAIEPEVIVEIIKKRIEKTIDKRILDEFKTKVEDKERELMILAAEKLDEGTLEENKIIYRDKIKKVVVKSVLTVFKTKIKKVFVVKKCKACAKRKKKKGKK